MIVLEYLNIRACAASSLRWWGLCCVWDCPHQIRVRRATRKDVPPVLQVRISAKRASITLLIRACLTAIKSNLLSNKLSVSFSSPENRKDFVKTVHSILREKHRRQLLKTESLPLNQQYVPFGGKRLCALKGARPTINRAGECQSSSSKCPTLLLTGTQRLSFSLVCRQMISFKSNYQTPN